MMMFYWLDAENIFSFTKTQLNGLLMKANSSEIESRLLSTGEPLFRKTVLVESMLKEHWKDEKAISARAELLLRKTLMALLKLRQILLRT